MSPAAAGPARTIGRFCSTLRSEHGFGLGPAETLDAVRAAEVVGIKHPRRFRMALRLVCCSLPEQRETFERAFDLFFLHPFPTTQPRPSEQRPVIVDSDRPAPQEIAHPARSSGDTQDDSLAASARKRNRIPAHPAPIDAQAWMTLLARYSPSAAAAPSGEPPVTGDALLRAATRLIDSVRAGRSRDWHPQPRGSRLDIRRTFRASLRTAGDPLTLRRLGHPARNPRFVLLIDASRSMAEHRALTLGFAHAMLARSRRTGVWLFSTALRDVTRDLRTLHPSDSMLRDLGEAWGGGTRIGGALLEFVRLHGARWLDDDTTVLIFSDGLDAGEIDEMRRALKEMRSRRADVIWINPHAGVPGFSPTARAMKAALPLIGALAGVRELSDLCDLPERIRAARRAPKR